MDYKPIRNKIRRFTTESLTREILLLLRKIEINEKLRLPFFHLLLLLKWNYEFSDKNYGAKKATRTDITKLCDKISELEMSHAIFRFSTSSGLRKPFIILAHQQFTYQQRCHWDTFARHKILFDDLRSKYDINKSFQNLAGITVFDFLYISFVLYIIFFIAAVDKNLKGIYRGYISPENIDTLKLIFPEEKIIKYIQLLSTNPTKLAEDILKDGRGIRSYNMQSFEASFFTRKPFFFYNNVFLIPYKDILYHTFHYFIYEFLKQKDHQFTTELGARLEKYVQLGLDELNLNYQKENDLREKFGKKSKVVDYIVDDRIFIEVKAIEVKPYVSANPDDQILAKEFRKNITKAYLVQMMEMINRMQPNVECYGIIITYKKLFLGNSIDVWEQFLKKEARKIGLENKMRLLPPENLFIIDIESWDRTLQILKTNKISLVDVLEKIKNIDANPQSKKFNFSMHLDDFKINKINLSYLLEAYTHFGFKNK